jgi:hypothetical protein
MVDVFTNGGGLTLKSVAKRTRLQALAEELFPEFASSLVHVEGMLTPEKARELVDGHAFHDLRSKRVMLSYAALMKAVMWRLNGEPIIISDKGKVLDGHTRLHACIEANVAFPTSICIGITEEAFRTINQGARRTYAHSLAIEGVTNAKYVQTALYQLMTIKDGKPPHDHVFPVQYDEWYRKHPGIELAVAQVLKAKHCYHPGTLMAWYYMATFLSPDHKAADRALQVIHTGKPYYQDGDPLHALRERYFRERSKPGESVSTKRARLLWIWSLMSCWNDFVNGVGNFHLKLRKNEVQMQGVDYSEL